MIQVENKKNSEHLQELDYIIQHQAIKTVFQPILSLQDGSILGHEALSRINAPIAISISNTEALFQLATEYNKVWDLETLCRTRALETAFLFMKPPYKKKLFLNVNPNIMYDPKFKNGFTRDFLKQYDITPDNIIFEVTERNVIQDMNGFITTVNHYRNQDYCIAIDDAGAGYCGLNLINDIRPEYIKLDMQLVRDINSDNYKYTLVKGLQGLSEIANVHLIAEGIETKEELTTLIELGIEYGQGYYLQKPAEEVIPISDQLLHTIKDLNHKKRSAHHHSLFIESLCTFTETISPDTPVERVYDIMQHIPNCIGLCIVENNIVQGVITKENLLFSLSGRYGYTLHQHKPIRKIMNTNFLMVEHTTSIHAVSQMAMKRPHDQLYDFIVVARRGDYLGTVTIKDLLQKTSEIEVTNAKQQNPLSGLAGNLVIEQQLSLCIDSASPCSIAYLDIDNFKAYNDVYGFHNGDKVIRLLADVLQDVVPSTQFIGHIGGDDFVVITDDFSAKSLCNEVVQKFEKEVLALYEEKDVKNGYVTVENRHGEIEQFPLISLSVAGITNENIPISNKVILTTELAKLKKIAKKQKGSHQIWC